MAAASATVREPLQVARAEDNGVQISLDPNIRCKDLPKYDHPADNECLLQK